MTVYVDTPVTASGRIAALAGQTQVSGCRFTSDETRAELHRFADTFRSSQAVFIESPDQWHYRLAAYLRPAALAAGAVPMTRAQMRELFDYRTPGPGEPIGAPGITPGTATCLTCWWRCRSGADACERAALHGRQSGHPTLARGLAVRDAVARAGGALFAEPEPVAPGNTPRADTARGRRLPAPRRTEPAAGQESLF